ncbi:putative transcriptional regulator, Crp/Fnr family [Gloeothece citriformis PCC 7424]|uniref:Putative transcriptional regulator, Crp/Fnr family n=1 Tax=Gloeothece citriformis (strain PCC 7424) TaxID=65393 RepID=B7K9A2_GLOC7|nr:Crp/Fnr family transcriptional regulator [Gloeothece citriformis]ACK68585.1 putative transcriptional regulator, Crp/Fnr family [Gloeothece citriformis PCC 7424]
MHASIPSSNPSPFNLTEKSVFDWAKCHYRDHTFNKDEIIPTRPGLLYFVEQGAIRIVGKAQTNETLQKQDHNGNHSLSEEVFLGFVGTGQPFEIVSQFPISLKAFAHLESTCVIWLYWQDLDHWPLLKQEVFDTFRYQHQRKLLWLSMLGQKRTIDRLLGFLTLLVEEYGQPCDKGYYLPYPLTHAQIASAIGTTRVTVTRLMGRLRQEGLVALDEEHLIYLPNS